MNIINDFDFIDVVKNVNEDYTPFKVVRNNRNLYLKECLPLLTFLSYLTFGNDFLKKMPMEIFTFFLFHFSFEVVLYNKLGDRFKDESANQLKILASKLKDMNIDTNIEFLKEAKCYKRIYNLKLNEKKLPQIIESKYILIPSYDYKGDIFDTSLMQEHVVGSSTYVLSIGEPKKVLKLATFKI